MENYEKGKTVEVDGDTDLPCREDAVHMKVSNGSKIRNLMGFAMKKIKDPSIIHLTWNGAGNAIPKVISCAEITKRNVKGLHQITKATYKRIEEYWEPKMEGLERLKVNKDIPVMSILLSKEPLDENEPGYQAPGSFDAFWKKSIREDGKSSRRKSKANTATPTGDSGHDPPSMARKRKKKSGPEKQDSSHTKGPRSSGDKKTTGGGDQKGKMRKKKEEGQLVAGEGSCEVSGTADPQSAQGKQSTGEKPERTDKQKQKKDTKTRENIEKTGSDTADSRPMDTS